MLLSDLMLQLDIVAYICRVQLGDGWEGGLRRPGIAYDTLMNDYSPEGARSIVVCFELPRFNQAVLTGLHERQRGKRPQRTV